MNYDSILSERIKDVKPSGIRRFFDILEEMKDAISLGIGEPDFVTPWHIRDAGIYSLEKGFTKYTSNAGMSELRREIAAYLNRRFHLQYDFAHEIIVTVGGSEAIDLSLRCMVNPGDEVIIPVPSFVCYGPLTSMAGGTPVYVETKAENEFRLTAEELRAAITPPDQGAGAALPQQPHRRHHGAQGPGGRGRGAAGHQYHGPLRRDLCRAHLWTASRPPRPTCLS